jgi:hypothetical protein
MAWDVGKQRRRKSDTTINQDMMEAEGHLDEKDAKILLYRFLRENVSFATKVLMGVELFPFQHISIKGMFLADYFLGIWARGLSKSFSTGIFAAMYAMMEQGVSIGIVSKTFRQSKMIFSKIEDIANDPKAALFRQAIDKIEHRNDEWTMTIGKSKIRALPLGDGEKLRGYRFHVMIIDELLLMPEKIINEVIMPFLGVVQNPTERKKVREAEDKLVEMGRLDPEDRTVWMNNKMIGLSSASYKFEHLYTMYSNYVKLIMDPPKDKESNHIITHFAYDIAPQDLYDKNLLEHAKNTMSISQFKREFGAEFTEDSSGYFKLSRMMMCTYPDGEGLSVEIRGNPNDKYILSVDPSWSESDSSDDFAMHVIKLHDETETGTVVHSYAMSGTNLKKHIAYMIYVLDNFNIVAMVMDYNGGQQYLSSLNESAEFKERGLQIQTLDQDFDKPENYQKELRHAHNEYNIKTKKYCVLRKPSSNWIRNANESLQAAFDHKRIMFAGMALDEDYKRQIAAPEINLRQIEFSKEEFTIKGQSNAARMIDFLEIQTENLSVTRSQCALIEVSTSPQGTQSFDLPLELRKQEGKNKQRKDSYSALVLGNWMMELYFDIVKTPKQMPSFSPRFVK